MISSSAPERPIGLQVHDDRARRMHALLRIRLTAPACERLKQHSVAPTPRRPRLEARNASSTTEVSNDQLARRRFDPRSRADERCARLASPWTTSRRRFRMLGHRASIRLTVALALASVTWFARSASVQSIHEENKVAAEVPTPSDLASQLTAVKAENAAFREELRKMAEQQKALLQMVE